MTNTNKKIVIAARRGLDITSSQILHEVYLAYPKEVLLQTIGKKLHIIEKTIQSSVKKIVDYGVPIELKINKDKEKTLRANIKEPISWILKEKHAAENMLTLFEDMDSSGAENVVRQQTINKRIYTEYLDSLNDLFDKWNSLRLLDQLDKPL